MDRLRPTKLKLNISPAFSPHRGRQMERTVPIRLMQTHTTCRMLPLAILRTQSTPSGCMRKADRHGKNDRGVRALRTIQSLSSDQIRTHYIIYSCLLAKYYQNTVNINEATQASGLEMFLGAQEFLMEINVSNPKVESYSEDMIADTVSHCLFGVADESLISINLMWGPKEHMKNEKNWVRGSGLVVAPSPSGFELFRLGLGESQSTTSSILMDSSIQKKIDGALVERMRPQIPPG